MRPRTQQQTQRPLAAPGSSNEVKNLITRLRFALAREHVQDPAHYVQEVVGSILNVQPGNTKPSTIGPQTITTATKNGKHATERVEAAYAPSTLGRVINNQSQENDNNNDNTSHDEERSSKNTVAEKLSPVSRTARKEFVPVSDLLPFSIRPGRTTKRPSSARVQRDHKTASVSSGARRVYQPRPGSARPSSIASAFGSHRRVGIANEHSIDGDRNSRNKPTRATTAKSPSTPHAPTRPSGSRPVSNKPRPRPQSASRYRKPSSVLPSTLQGYLEQRISHYENKYGSDVFQRPKGNQHYKARTDELNQCAPPTQNVSSTEEQGRVIYPFRTEQKETANEIIQEVTDSGSTLKQANGTRNGNRVRPATARTQRSFDKHIERQRRAGIIPSHPLEQIDTNDSSTTAETNTDKNQSATTEDQGKPSSSRRSHKSTGPPPRRKTSLAYLHSGDPQLTQRAQSSIDRHVDQMNRIRSAKQFVRETEQRNIPFPLLSEGTDDEVVFKRRGKGHKRAPKYVFRVLSGWRAAVILQRFLRGMLARRLAQNIRKNGYGFALAQAASWYMLRDVERSLSRSSSMSSIDGVDIIT